MQHIIHFISLKTIMFLVLLVTIVAVVEIIVLRQLTEVVNYYLLGTSTINAVDLTILLGGSLLKLCLGPTLTYHIYKTSLNAQLEISTRIANKALNVDERTYNKHPTGHWLNVANVETAQFCSGFINSYIFRSAEAIILLSIFLYLAIQVNLLTLTLLIPLLCVILPATYVLRKLVRSWGKQRQRFENQRIQILKDLLAARAIIKNANFDSNFVMRYRKSMSQSNLAQLKRFVGMSLPRYTIEMLCALILAYPLIANIFFKVGLEVHLESLAIFALALLRMIPSINKIISTTNEISFSKAPLNLINTFLNLPDIEAIKDAKEVTPKYLIKFNGNIANSNFSGKLKFSVLDGDIVAVTGPSGSGKSTILKQLSGLIVECNHISVQTANDVKIAYVSQEPYAFMGTVGYNIFGIDELPPSHNKLRLGDFGLDDLDLSENIGDGGRKLSGGELMRLNLMRAIASGANVICLDETLSALPKLQRDQIMDLIKTSVYFRAIIYVTHNTDDLTYANKTIELKNDH